MTSIPSIIHLLSCFGWFLKGVTDGWKNNTLPWYHHSKDPADGAREFVLGVVAIPILDVRLIVRICSNDSNMTFSCELRIRKKSLMTCLFLWRPGSSFQGVCYARPRRRFCPGVVTVANRVDSPPDLPNPKTRSHPQSLAMAEKIEA